MKVAQSSSQNSSKKKDIFSLPQFSQNINYPTEKEISTKREQNINLIINSRISNYENGGRLRKRNYREMMESNMDDEINNKNMNNINANMSKRQNIMNDNSSFRNSFYNEPSLIQKIKINNSNSKSKKKIISEFKVTKEEGEKNDSIKKEDLEKQKELDKKLINEYSYILEKILKEEQNLFLDDNYHVSQSLSYEKIPEDFSNYIISKRVNFPKEIFQNLDSNNSSESNEEDNFNFTTIFPPLNCIIFIQKNILIFFNYINESIYKYYELQKPVKKLLITIPKPGMFISDIKFIMIVIMEGEIHLLTLSFKNIDDDMPVIHKTDFIYTFNETVLDIISTANHRIFISTLNSKIFELNYTIKQDTYFNFFSSRNSLFLTNKESPLFFGLFSDLKYIFKNSIEVIYKLKTDDTRNLLYAIKYTIPKSEQKINLDTVMDSSIIVFDLGLDGKGFYKVMEISQEDLGDFNYNYNYEFNYGDNNNDVDNLMIKSNIIVDIAPLTRDKFKEYQLLIIKRNGRKIFIRFNTYIDDTHIKNQENILAFNSSALCRERITDRYITVIKEIPSEVNNNILYDKINYFPYNTFVYYKKKILIDENNYEYEYTLNAIDENLDIIAKKENLRLSNQMEGLKEKEEIIFKSTTDNKQLYSITKLSDYNIEDCCDLGSLLKYSSNGFFLCENTKYLDDNNVDEIYSYNSMHEYAKQLFYSPDEIGMLFTDEFIIFKKLRPIDLLIQIISNKNINIINNTLEEITNFNTNLESNSVRDFSNINNNDTFNISNKRRISLGSLGLGNRLNPLQINRKSLIFNDFKKFVNTHGYIETCVMLLNIMTNNNFCFYIKNNITNPNDINLNNNLNRCYFNSSNLIKVKNENQLMNLGQEYLLKLFKVAENDIDLQIYNYQILLQNLLNNFNISNTLVNLNKNNLKFKLNNDNNINKINLAINNYLFEGKNFISYGFVLFLSRIMRLFWEEKFFLRKKLYYQNDNFEFNIVNNLNQIQIMFIKNMLMKFINSVNEFKMELLQNAADITSKANKLKNYINDIELFLKNNSGYTINEIRKKLTKEENLILNEHRKNLNYFIALFNFEKFSSDLDIILGIAKRAIEVLNLLDNIYKVNISKEIQKRKSYSILDIKIKDVYKNNYPFVVNELLQIIYEFYFKEKNMEFATIKLQEIIYQSPNIINKNSAYAIEGNFLLKFCNYYQLDDIDKIKYIKEALEKIN